MVTPLDKKEKERKLSQAAPDPHAKSSPRKEAAEGAPTGLPLFLQGQGVAVADTQSATAYWQGLPGLGSQPATSPAAETPTSEPLAATTVTPDNSVLWTMTIPLESLVPLPEREDMEALFAEMVANPEEAASRGQELAANDARREYLEDKLHWPVEIEARDVQGSEGYCFSVYGDALVCSMQPQLPLEGLDQVSFEPLRVVAERAAKRAHQVVTAAMLQVVYSEIIDEKGDLPRLIAGDPEDYALNEALGLAELMNQLSDQADLLMRTLDPSNEWLRFKFGVLHQQIHSFRDEAGAAYAVAFKSWDDNQPSRTYGEVYDETIASAEARGGASKAVGGALLKIAKYTGEIVTGGGQGLDAQNARMYRAGEISYNAFKKNRWWNIGRVGVNAVITALTFGRASGAASRFLGLGAGTRAAAVAGGMAEGMAGGFAQSFSSDVYAKVVSQLTSDPGVAAFHEATIGGPQAWLSSTAWGGLLGGGMALAGSFIPKTPDLSKLRQRTPTNRTEMSLADDVGVRVSSADQPELALALGDDLEVRVIGANELTGDLTLAFRQPATGELFTAQGNAYTGNAVVTSATTGEVVGYFRGGKFGPPAPGGALPAPVGMGPTTFGGAPLAETGLVTVSESATAGPLAPFAPLAPAAEVRALPPGPKELSVGELLTVPLKGGTRSEVIAVEKDFIVLRHKSKSASGDITHRVRRDVFEGWVAEGSVTRWTSLRQQLMQNRPPHSEELVEMVWERAKKPDGNVYDPHPPYEKLEWDRSRSRYDQWHMGHRPGEEYHKLVDRLCDGEITFDQFLQEYNDPNKYWPELPSKNLSHRYQAK